MKITEKQMKYIDIAELALIIILLCTMAFASNMSSLLICTVIGFISLIWYSLLRLCRDMTIRNEIIANKDNIKDEIINHISSGKLAELSAMELNTILNILERTNNR